jgi:type IV pilus assembly protein PilW
MNIRNLSRSTPHKQLGVTLVELMVSLLLGLLVTGGVIQIFVSNRATYAFNEGLARVQENGRSALDALAYNVRMVGFFGCLSTDITVFNNLNSAATLPFNFEQGITGFEAVDTEPGKNITALSSNPANSSDGTKWSPNLPGAPLSGNVIPGSDVLVIRNVTPTSNSLQSPFVSASDVNAFGAAASYQAGDIGIVSDCQKASIFQVTGVADTTSGGIASLRLTHTASGTPGNALASWGTDQEYAAGAQLMRGETWIYYVGARADGVPALFQQRLQSTSASTTAALVAEELVEHVETMQITYGVDNGLDGSIDSYQTAAGVADWAEVVSVRVGLLMRSPEEYGTEFDDAAYVVNETGFDPVDDRRVRQVFTTTIAIRNRLP